MHPTPARRNPGAWDCAAAGVPRAREGSRILNPPDPPRGLEDHDEWRSGLCLSEVREVPCSYFIGKPYNS